MVLTAAVGSYPRIGDRPEEQQVRRAIAKLDRGEITREDLRAAEDQVTQEVIAAQVAAGLDLVSDGLVRWEDSVTYLARQIRGFTIGGLIRYFDTNTFYRQPVAEAELEWTGPITVGDYQFARAHSPRPVKAVLTGPYTLAKLSLDKHYGDFKALVRDLARVLNREVLALEAAEAPWVQLDEPAILRHKDDFPLFQEALELVTAGVTRAQVALQTYFGDLDGLYPQVLELPVDLLGVDLSEYGQRSWALLKRGRRKFPKLLGAGLIDGRNTKLEEPEAVLQQLRALVKKVPLDRIHLTPSCGLEFLPRNYAQRKLERLVAIARQAKEVLA